LDGASTVATAAFAVVSLLAEVTGAAEVEACALGEALIDGAGTAASSFFEELFVHTTSAKRTIPSITAFLTAFDVPCAGATTGLAATEAFGVFTTGVVETLTRSEAPFARLGTGGTVNVDVALFFTADFFATFLVVFLAVFFTTDFLATLFFAVVFLVADFLATLLRATLFLAVFFATDFFATAFFTTLFVVDFFTATFTP
jgi:hypothetical protein